MSTSQTKGPFTPGADFRIRFVDGPAAGSSRLSMYAPVVIEVTGIETRDGVKTWVQHRYERGLPSGNTVEYRYAGADDDGPAQEVAQEPELAEALA